MKMIAQQLKENQLKDIKESVHQFRVCKWLDERNIVYFAVPNGYKKSKFQQAQAKREGLKAGVPDIIILTKAKNDTPTALELKKYMGEKHKLPCNCMSESQKEWQTIMTQNGFNHVLAHGEDEAIQDLIELGY